MKAQAAAVTAATIGVIAAVLTGCSTTATPAPTASATTATSTAAAAASTPVPTFTTAVATDAPAGTAIPADQVKAAKDAGMHVYVSPTGDGTGLVLQAGQPIPDQVIADNQAATPTEMPSTLEESVAGGRTASASQAAITAAGLPVVFILVGGEWGTDGHLMNTLWFVGVQNVPDHDAINKSLDGFASHAEAQAKAQALAVQYGAQVIDAG